jgi:large subunit ribosomal protein L4
VVFAPKPRDYRYTVPKKIRRLAMKSALSAKVADGEIIVLEDLKMEAPKTKELLGIVNAIKAGDRKVLFVLPENSANIYLSSRNLPEVKVITVNEINTYNIMNAYSLVLVDGVQDILASRANC